TGVQTCALPIWIIGAALVPRGDGRRAATPQGQAPEFHLADLRNPSDSLSLSQFRGHPLVLNFWASWCEPCKREMPALQAVYRRVHTEIRFVGIDHQDARSDALQFLRQTGATYPSAYAPVGAPAGSSGLCGL